MKAEELVYIYYFCSDASFGIARNLRLEPFVKESKVFDKHWSYLLNNYFELTIPTY